MPRTGRARATLARARSRRQARLEAVIAALRARYGDHIIRLAADAAALPPDTALVPLSTGSLSLDLLVGGLPRGAISEVFGPDGAGKGTLTYAALAACQHAGGLALLVDADGCDDPDALEAAGVDLARLIVGYPATATEGWDIVRALARSGALDLLALTSLSGLLALPGSGWGPSYLERRMDRLLAALRGRRTALLATNLPVPRHWTEGVAGGTGEAADWPLATVGGRPVAQAATLRIAFRPTGVRYTPAGDAVGMAVHAWVVKHHGAPRGPLLALEMRPGGPRRAAELVVLAEATGCLTHSRLGLTLPNGRVLGRSAERAACALEADASLAAELEVHVRQAWLAAPFPLGAPCAAGS
jgi:recombination protein RecA